MTDIHICTSAVISWKIVHRKCPNCNKRKFLVESFEWYPATFSCLNCGDQWAEGERLERPFMRGWREKAIESFIKRVEYLKENQSVIDANMQAVLDSVKSQ